MGSKIGLDRFRANKDEGEPRVGAPQTQTTRGEIEIEVEDLETGRKTITRSKEELQAFLESELQPMFKFLECHEVLKITMWRQNAKIYTRKTNPNSLFSEYELERFFSIRKVIFEFFRVYYVDSMGFEHVMVKNIVLTTENRDCYQEFKMSVEGIVEDILRDLGLIKQNPPKPTFSLEL